MRMMHTSSFFCVVACVLVATFPATTKCSERKAESRNSQTIRAYQAHKRLRREKGPMSILDPSALVYGSLGRDLLTKNSRKMAFSIASGEDASEDNRRPHEIDSQDLSAFHFNETESRIRRAKVQYLLARAQDLRTSHDNYTLLLGANEKDPDDIYEAVSGVGVVMFAQGRSGTSSLSETLRASTDLHFCNDIKESFEEHNMTTDSFEKCAEMARKKHQTGFYAHIKPFHVLRNYRWTVMHPGLHLQPVSVSTFFDTILKGRVDLFLAAFRDNQLERHVSSFELHLSHHSELKRTGRKSNRDVPVVETQAWKDLVDQRFMNANLIQIFEEDARRYVDATKMAVKSGIPKVIQLFFAQYVGHNLCHATEDLWSTIRRIAVRKRLDLGLQSHRGAPLPSIFRKEFRCRKIIEQTHTSHHRWSLDMRIGRAAAEAVRKQLSNTPYEWMLDLTVTTWPRGVHRPVPVQVKDVEYLNII